VILVQCHTGDLDSIRKILKRRDPNKQTMAALARGDPPARRSSPERQPREGSRIFLTRDSVKNFLCLPITN
jgi:hypothetical protein